MTSALNNKDFRCLDWYKQVDISNGSIWTGDEEMINLWSAPFILKLNRHKYMLTKKIHFLFIEIYIYTKMVPISVISNYGFIKVLWKSFIQWKTTWLNLLTLGLGLVFKWSYFIWSSCFFFSKSDRLIILGLKCLIFSHFEIKSTSLS